jgi:hypothetical protein
MSIFFRILFLAFLLAFSKITEAQLLTVQDAVGQAIQNNAQINQMRSQLDQKKEELRTQTGISSPEFSLDTKHVHWDFDDTVKDYWYPYGG